MPASPHGQAAASPVPNAVPNTVPDAAPNAVPVSLFDSLLARAASPAAAAPPAATAASPPSAAAGDAVSSLQKVPMVPPKLPLPPTRSLQERPGGSGRDGGGEARVDGVGAAAARVKAVHAARRQLSSQCAGGRGGGKRSEKGAAGRSAAKSMVSAALHTATGGGPADPAARNRRLARLRRVGCAAAATEVADSRGAAGRAALLGVPSPPPLVPLRAGGLAFLGRGRHAAGAVGFHSCSSIGPGGLGAAASCASLDGRPPPISAGHPPFATHAAAVAAGAPAAAPSSAVAAMPPSASVLTAHAATLLPPSATHAAAAAAHLTVSGVPAA